MALNIKDRVTEELATEVAALTGDTKTGAVRVALQERRARLRKGSTAGSERRARLQRLLEEEIWPSLPPGVRGAPIGKQQREEILGLGPEGV